VPSLLALTEVAEVVAVVCQPDKPAGRGLELTEAPVKREARARDLPVHQPTKMRDGTFAAWLAEQRADVALVVAYGRILPPDVLAAPRLGCVNVHASLLPRWRGAAPINWAVLAGDARTGVTLMQMDAGMDTGPILTAHETAIGPDETSEALFHRLAALGAECVRADLPRYLAGQLAPAPQDESRATAAPMLTKDMARIDWRKGARAVHNQVRGLRPWPGASTTFGARRVIVHATTLEGAPVVTAGAPGEVIAVTRERIWIATPDGAVALTEVQLEGKRRVPVREFLADRKSVV
jgi:methionyl-tRNA formyltransferase